MDKQLRALGNRVTEYGGLEVFPRPEAVTKVIMTSDEVTAVCPVTGQPDWYLVKIAYAPDRSCIESKTLKLFLQSFRNRGIFCEALSTEILNEVVMAARPHSAEVRVLQKPRGGVGIEATSMFVGEGEKT